MDHTEDNPSGTTGRMIRDVYAHQLSASDIFAPAKLEAGTPGISDVLTDEIIENYFNQYTQAAFDPEMFLLQVLTSSDKWGRPLNAGPKGDFTDRLNAIDPQKPEWVKKRLGKTMA